MRRALLVGWLLPVVAALTLLPAVSWAQGPGPVIDVIQLKGLIDPPTAAYLEGRIAAAQSSGTDEAVIIELDSGGGLVDSAPQIAQRVEASLIPVVVWVAPRGAQAAGAGALLLAAGHLAFMAQDTRLGSAAPVNLNSSAGPVQVRETMALTARFASAHQRSLPSGLTHQDSSITSEAALRAGAIDGIASSLAEVLKKMDGRTVRVAGSNTVSLETWDQQAGRPSVGFRFEEMNLVARALHAVTSPEVAFLLLLVGAFGLIFEAYNPGIGLSAIIGLGSLAGSFYALNNLPANWVGVLVIVAAVACFVVDLQLSGFGIWSAAGVIGLVAGGIVLFWRAPAAASLSPWAIGAGVVMSLLFFVSVMTAALRVRLRRPITGEEGIVGTVGEARTDIAPEGTVFTKGKVWRARTMETGIAAGSKVTIKATEGLVLLVEPLSESEAGGADLPERGRA